jgi:hypothetical protein
VSTLGFWLPNLLYPIGFGAQMPGNIGIYSKLVGPKHAGVFQAMLQISMAVARTVAGQLVGWCYGRLGPCVLWLSVVGFWLLQWVALLPNWRSWHPDTVARLHDAPTAADAKELSDVAWRDKQRALRAAEQAEAMVEADAAGPQEAASKRMSFPQAAMLVTRFKSRALRQYTLPEIFGAEHVLDERKLSALWHGLPPRLQVADWELVYGLDRHGASMATFYRRAARMAPSLLLIQTTSGVVFGAAAGAAWDRGRAEDYAFYGKGDCTFLFRFDAAAGLVMYPCTQRNASFQCAGGEALALGASAEGAEFGLRVTGLRLGETAPCETFGNGNLLDGGAAPARFEVANMELWGFDCGERLRENVGANIIQSRWRARPE